MTRSRSWLFLIVTALATALYVLWWSTYAQIHQQDRYAVLAPGAPAEVGGATVRLIGLQQSAQLADTDPTDEPEAPLPGTVWVVATVEVVKSVTDDRSPCGVQLVDTDLRAWSTTSTLADRTLPRCSSGEIVAGQPYRFEATFAVPERFAASIAGLAVPDPTTARRTSLLRPPA